MKRLRILLVDDHEVVLLGLRTLVDSNPDMIVVAEAGTAQEALLLVEQKQPDVVVLDLRLPDRSGLEVCREIRKRFPKTQVVILTSYISEEFVSEALKSGAAGYVLKEVGNEELLRAIRAAMRGEIVLDSSASSYMVTRLRNLESKVDNLVLKDLSSREIDILKLVGQGNSNREIGTKLNLSPITVRNYVSNILGKLGCSNRVQLAIFAAEHRLLEEFQNR
jgi:DNA-binding NarL/FixJ family response regulator